MSSAAEVQIGVISLTDVLELHRSPEGSPLPLEFGLVSGGTASDCETKRIKETELFSSLNIRVSP